MALSSAPTSAGALVVPQYGIGEHVHAVIGGGKLKHKHEDAEPGHGHPKDKLLPLPGGDEKAPRTVDEATREDWRKRGWTMPDLSYPIPDAEHGGRDFLRRAILSFGRGGADPATKRHIIRRAQALGLSDMLPEEWQERKWFALDFELKANERANGDLVLDGYANTWAVDRDDERFARKAFEEAIDRYMLNPVICLDHNRRQPIGAMTVRPVLDDTGVRVRGICPKPDDRSEPWHIKAWKDIRDGVRRTFSVGGVFHRSKSDIGLIEAMDWVETSVVTVPANPYSVFVAAEAKGFGGFEEKATAQPGVGRGHGRHHHGALGKRRVSGRAHPRVTGRHVHTVAAGGSVVHKHGTTVAGHTHAGMLAHRTDAEIAKRLDIAPEAVPAIRAYAAQHGLDPVKLNAAQSVEAIRAANPGVSDQALGLQAGVPPPTHRSEKADGPEDIDDEDAADEADEIEDRGDLGELIAGLVEAIEEIADRDDESEEDRVGALNELFDRFRDEASDAITDQGDDVPDDEDGKAWAEAVVTTTDAAAARRLSAALRRKETVMAVKSAADQPPATEDAGSGQEQVDVTAVKEMRAKLAALEDEKRERELQEFAESEARKRVEAETKAAEEADKKASEEAARIEDIVRKKVEAMRPQIAAAQNSGRKFVHVASADAQFASSGKGDMGAWLKDLRDARRGNYDAFKRIEAGHTKSMAEYGYDEKALGETSNAGGGYLVPPEYWQAGLAEFRLPASPMEQLIPHMPATSNVVLIPRATATAAVGWVAENATKPSQDQTFAQISVPIFALAGISKVSNQMLNDSSPTVDPFVRKDLGRNLGLAIDKAILSGSGNGQPVGIYNTAGIVSYAVGSSQKYWTAISESMAAIATAYFGQATVVVAHPRDVAALRESQDSQGRPLFFPGYLGQQTLVSGGYINDPASIKPVGQIFGLDVYEDANIPTNLGAGTNETFMLVARLDEDVVLERQGMTMDVSSEAGTSFEANQTWFRGEQRLGYTGARQPAAHAVLTGLTPPTVGSR